MASPITHCSIDLNKFSRDEQKIRNKVNCQTCFIYEQNGTINLFDIEWLTITLPVTSTSNAEDDIILNLEEVNSRKYPSRSGIIKSAFDDKTSVYLYFKDELLIAIEVCGISDLFAKLNRTIKPNALSCEEKLRTLQKLDNFHKGEKNNHNPKLADLLESEFGLVNLESHPHIGNLKNYISALLHSK